MKQSFYKKTFMLMIVTITCQCINLFRDVLLARSFGASNINDVYLVSQTIVSVIITMINSPMATAYVPVATKYFVNENEKDRNAYVSRIYSDVILVSIILVVFEILTIDGIAKIAAPGFENEAREMLKTLVLIQAPMTLINIIKGVNRGNFQILQKFNISELTNIFPYLCMCVYLLTPVNKNIYMVAGILSVGACLSIIPELIILSRHGFRFRFSPGLNRDIKIIVSLMMASAITAGIREINVMFDKSIGTLLPEGNITMLSYASKLTVVVVGLISSSISIVGFANIAKLKNQNREGDVLEGIAESCNLINFLIVPISVYLIVFSYDIVKLLYYGGDFSLSSVKTTADLMKIYAIGLIGYGFQDVFTRTLHAYKIVKYTIKESVLMVVINIFFNLLLYRVIGAYGVALATSAAILIVIPILGRDVQKNIGYYDNRGVLKYLSYTFFISLLVAILAIIMKVIIKKESVLIFVAETIVCGIAYLVFSYLTKNKVLLKLMGSKYNEQK